MVQNEMQCSVSSWCLENYPSNKLVTKIRCNAANFQCADENSLDRNNNEVLTHVAGAQVRGPTSPQVSISSRPIHRSL